MELTDKDFKKVKALHVTTKIPVYISDLKFNRIRTYCSDTQYHFSYDFSHHQIPETYVWFDYGLFHEIFISFRYKDNIVTMGPFLTGRILKSQFESFLNRPEMIHKSHSEKKEYLKYYQSLPIYSLGDIRDFIVLLSSVFDIDFEQLYSANLHKQVYQNELKLKDGYLNIDYNYLPPEKYSFYYENQILNLVISGDITALKQGIADIGCSVIPSSTGDNTRAEKNYTIVILEKLSSLAIHAGKDILDAIRLRDFYIKKLEIQTTLIEVLAIRDCAIIHFTKELHGLSDKKYSPLIISVIQYINLKIYDSFKIPELAKHFFMSESALRRRFKSEVGINITEYVNKRKITIAKVFLGTEMPISEISKKLGFFDASHFHRIFKSFEGITPKQFQTRSKDIIHDKTEHQK